MAGVLWFRVFLKYRAVLQASGRYPDPPAEAYVPLFRKKPGAYEQFAAARSVLDSEARAGALGPDAQRLVDREARMVRVMLASLPIGLGLGLAMIALIK